MCTKFASRHSIFPAMLFYCNGHISGIEWIDVLEVQIVLCPSSLTKLNFKRFDGITVVAVFLTFVGHLSNMVRYYESKSDVFTSLLK